MQSTLGLSPEELAFLTTIFIGRDGEEPPAGGEGGEENGTDSGRAADSDKSKTGDPQKKITALEEEKQRHYDSAQAEKKRADDLQAKLDEQERSKRTDEENRQRDLEAAQKTNSTLTETVNRLAIENAFLKDASVKWQDMDAALRLTDLSAVQIAEDGTVKNPDVLSAAIKETATKRSYLVAKESEGDPEDTTPPPASGQPPKPGPKGDPLKSPDYLKSKYPALRR